jgi:putative oxidoreductase
MENNSQHDIFTSFLNDGSLRGPFLLVARVLTAVSYSYYILTWLFGSPAMRAYMEPPQVSASGVNDLLLFIQIVAVVLIVLGYRTRVAALVLSVFTVITYVLAGHGLKDFGIAGGLFAMFALGPGPLSLDARLARARSSGAASSERDFFAPIFNNSALMAPLILLARIFVAAIFITFGQNKFFHTARMQAYMVGHNPTFGGPNQLLTLLIYPAMWLQLIGGFLVIIGYKTRHALLALAGFTLIAGNMFHHQFNLPAEQVQFFKDYSLTGALLYLFAYGAGSLSVDALLSRAKPARENTELKSQRT